jgi:DNA-binding MarR family transcriptional regulator
MASDVKNSINLLSHIHSQSSDFLQKKLAEKGFENFASSHGNILFQLSRAENLRMNELSKIINRDKSTTTVLVRRLEKEGLVKSQPSSEDKRIRIVSLTEKGKHYNCVTGKISEELIEKFYSGFSEEEKNLFTSLLSRIAENFGKQE